jgi:succinyl-CoA synthetase beta subunit
LLDRLGIARPPSAVVEAAGAMVPNLPFAYPVAAKILSANVTHKSDIGGVVLGIENGAALTTAVARMRTSAQAHGHSVDRFLVQSMMTGIGEALIGYRVDRDVGPLVMVAVGGIFTEIYRDRSLRLAPVDLATAHEMIAEVRGFQMLAGYRNKPAGDLDALAHAIVALSQLADDASIMEAEINPLMVRPAGQGAVAVDAVVRRV